MRTGESGAGHNPAGEEDGAADSDHSGRLYTSLYTRNVCAVHCSSDARPRAILCLLCVLALTAPVLVAFVWAVFTSVAPRLHAR
jgi:hypothetical protein